MELNLNGPARVDITGKTAQQHHKSRIVAINTDGVFAIYESAKAYVELLKLPAKEAHNRQISILGCARASGKSGKLHMTHDMYFCYEDSKIWQELKNTER